LRRITGDGTLRPNALPRYRDVPINTTLKRRLRPLRPVLLPTRRALHDANEWAAARLARGIRPLTQREFEDMTRRFPYYEGRWSYTSAALALATELIKRRHLRTALELGAPLRPIIVGAHVMDVTARPELDPRVSITVHDATKEPWPFDDKAYDLFMALQVFEHLGDRQPEAFREVRRIARNAIISLPIDWEMEDPTNCHHRIPNERVLSWFAPIVPTRVIEGSGGKRRRLIYVFEDLPA
jgi:hypothetical protein